MSSTGTMLRLDSKKQVQTAELPSAWQREGLRRLDIRLNPYPLGGLWGNCKKHVNHLNSRLSCWWGTVRSGHGHTPGHFK
jgi:hypothetical protein